MSHSDDEGKGSVLHATALYLFAGLVYIVFFIIHIVQKRTLEQHLVFAVFFIYVVCAVGILFFPFPYRHELIVGRQDEHVSYINVLP